MSRLSAFARTLIYAAGFVLLWGTLALAVRPLDRQLPWRLPPASETWGAALMILGAALALWCFVAFSAAGHGTPAPFDPPRRLVPVGPYRWVRNPMYVGALFVLVGFGLWNRSPAMLLFVIPAALAAHLFVVLYEEPHLQGRFGEEYAAYRRKVRRWIPTPP